MTCKGESFGDKEVFILLLHNFLRLTGGVYGHSSAILAVVSMPELNE